MQKLITLPYFTFKYFIHQISIMSCEHQGQILLVHFFTRLKSLGDHNHNHNHNQYLSINQLRFFVASIPRSISLSARFTVKYVSTADLLRI